MGIQIESPSSQLVAIRTVNTGTNPSQASYVLVNAVFACNNTGDPKDGFPRGALGYFKVTVSNYDIEPRHVLITINTYYPNNIPFGLASIETTLIGQTVSSTIISIPIPTDAPIGNAIAYADAYSGWPKQGGTPYCVGKSATFQITSGSALQAPTTQTSGTETTLSLDGNYKLTLQLTPKVSWGIYTVYVSSIYLGEEAFNSTTFRVRRLGDLDDDGDVDWLDLLLFRQAYIGEYNPDADLDFDDDVDWQDLFIFRQEYVKS